MTIVQIQPRLQPNPVSAFWSAGFRPFFLGAIACSVTTMFVWMGLFLSWWTPGIEMFAPMQWHAHEMVYGYCSAVIAGFLLTAVPNWTGASPVDGRSLKTISGLWFGARLCFLLGGNFFVIAALLDPLFLISLIVVTVRPIVRARQWKQIGIVSKLVLLLLGNCAFYFGALENLPVLVSQSIYAGLYLVVGLILTIAGRVFPAFIQNMVPVDVRLRNPRWLSVGSLIFFLLFFINQIFISSPVLLLVSATALAVLTSTRLIFWYCRDIWSFPLLWSFYLSIAWIDLGFVLFALSAAGAASSLLAVHAVAAGGIALVTLSMMARVSLGHTGRNVRNASYATTISFVLLLIAAFFRVVVPIPDATSYTTWIVVAQIFWIAAFASFGLGYFRILTNASYSLGDSA